MSNNQNENPIFEEVLKKLKDGSSNDEHVYSDECYPFQPLNTDNLSDIMLDVDAFKKGVQEMSELAGRISALANVGIPPESALEYIATMQAGDMTFKLQSKLSEDNTSANIKIAEISGENFFKQNY